MQNLLPLNNGAIETFAGERASPLLLHGFLFDMNAFFEQLITRFLTENLTGYTVKGQHRLTAMMAYQPEHNPQRRRPPPSIRIDPGMLGGGRWPTSATTSLESPSTARTSWAGAWICGGGAFRRSQAMTIRAYLCAGRTITTRLLAEKAVLLLTPELRLGEVVWGGEEINAATQSGRRGSQRE